jgi:hypothetical protein
MMAGLEKSWVQALSAAKHSREGQLERCRDQQVD